MEDVRLKKKRLAVFLDGTWNDEGDNTSVWRLRSLCASADADGMQQLIFYDTGLGTTIGEKIRGGVYGFGIDDHVKRAYEWLVENYNDGDDIFIFGFSRGAFTARCLAGLISICGIARPGTPLGVGQLYARYGSVDRNHQSIRSLFEAKTKGVHANLGREENWLLQYSRPTEILMIGVWDTVAAIDWPGATKHDFLDPNLRRDMKNAFHALAIDEHRHRFAPTLWTQSSPSGPPKIERDYSVVEQRWFVGAHANIGGGYPSDLLPQVPLQWIAEKASHLGLALRDEVTVEPKAAQDPVADSYSGFLHGTYRLASREYFRPIGDPIVERDGFFIQAINETIDKSVFDRWRADPKYRPPNLAAWSERRGIDVTTIDRVLRADAPTAPLSHAN